MNMMIQNKTIKSVLTAERIRPIFCVCVCVYVCDDMLLLSIFCDDSASSLTENRETTDPVQLHEGVGSLQPYASPPLSLLL